MAPHAAVPLQPRRWPRPAGLEPFVSPPGTKGRLSSRAGPALAPAPAPAGAPLLARQQLPTPAPQKRVLGTRGSGPVVWPLSCSCSQQYETGFEDPCWVTARCSLETQPGSGDDAEWLPGVPSAGHDGAVRPPSAQPHPSPRFCRSCTNITLSHGRGSPKPGDRGSGGGGRTGLPDGPEGGQWPRDLTERGRQAGSQTSPISFLPAGSRTPPHAPPQCPEDTVLGVTASCHAAVSRGRGGVGWPGGVVAPPAWQPRARRWQRLGSRCGGICAFAPAAHGHRREQDAPSGGSRPAAPQPGGSRVSLGQQPLPP